LSTSTTTTTWYAQRTKQPADMQYVDTIFRVHRLTIPPYNI
jgi:hypothetical protein